VARSEPLSPRKRTRAQRQGAWAEQRALRLLLASGWQLLDRNWRCRWGEIDLVMAKPGRLLLVEVKARQQLGADGGGRGALGWRKRQRLERAWDCWLAAHPGWSRAPVEQVAALVPLPPAREPVLWIRISS
jgi:putative endonuclease